ncbi:MAG: UvrB/UvrC motif-containing protein [Candidatus Glassbacteria bacterium]|nr:UvrB/UvrC motif-containing protein [Candidatus Glassbacteria bacterium]
MPEDITDLLNNWDFNPQKSYRKIVGENGCEIVQVRVDNAAFQGILQMQLDGRPDGKRPHGCEFVLDYHREALRRWREARHGDEGFKLNSADCAELFDESLRIYNRYVFLLQLQDYPRVVRDTERNMEVFRFVNRFAEREEDRNNLERWWPYILRINGTARAMHAVRETRDFEEALEIVRETRRKIEDLEPVEAREFETELERSLKSLEDLEQALMSQKPLNAMDKLRRKMELAVAEERYEDAAQLRDRLKEIEDRDFT